MSGALTERDFVHKLTKAGFVDIDIVDRTPFGVDDCDLYPLFTDDLRALMRKLIPPEQQSNVATSIVVKATLP